MTVHPAAARLCRVMVVDRDDMSGAEGRGVAPHVIRRVCSSWDKDGALLNNVAHGVAALVELCGGEFVGA